MAYGDLKIRNLIWNTGSGDNAVALSTLLTTGANTFTGNQSLGDNVKVQFGTGNDLQIFHNGTDSNILNSQGDFYIQNTGSNADDINIRAQDDINIQVQNGEPAINCIGNGAVELFFDSVKKFETTSSGGTLTGHLGVSDTSSNSASARIYLTSGNTADSSIYFARANDTATSAIRYEHTTNALQLWGYNNSLRAEINSSGNLRIPNDSGKITFGTGDDLQIYHNGTDSYIKNTTGGLNIASADGQPVFIRGGTNLGEMLAEFHDNGTNKLFYDNSNKLETTSYGISTDGKLNFNGTGDKILIGDNGKIQFGGGLDLQIYHDGSNSYIANSTGALILKIDNLQIKNAAGNESLIRATANGNAELYYDNSKKLETASYGTYVSGTSKADNFGVNDAGKYHAGSGNDLQIYHNGSNSYIINNTGETWIRGNDLRLASTAGEWYAQFAADAAVKLYYDNVKRFETTANGITVTGTVSDSKGDLRSIPQNYQSSNYTLVNSDAGKHILADGNIVWINGRHSAGDAITIVNATSGNITITKGTHMYNTADGNDNNRTLASRGMATILWVSGTVAYISGAGLS